MAWKTLDDMDLAGKRVLVRVDINVPVQDGKITDTTRIDRIVETVQDILKAGGKPILMAHFGRPKGKVVPEMSLAITLPALEKALGQKVAFADGGWDAAVATLSPGQVLLLENMRFFPGEEANDPAFAAELAALGDIYCNDAFSAAHRAHASTEGVAHLLPNCVGRNMQEELEALEGALGDPIRPVTAVVGGAKVSTKITLLSNLLDKVDHLIIGGGMANTFLLAQGHEIGQSLAEAEMTDTALEILEKAKGSGCEIHLPVDVVVAEEFKARAPHKVCLASECPPEGMILDAGPKTVTEICRVFEESETVIWNGPLGAFEIMPFGAATFAAARQAGALTDRGELITVAGGGDTVSALNMAKASYQFTYISTAGGAFLEWMEGKTLPGIAALGG